MSILCNEEETKYEILSYNIFLPLGIIVTIIPSTKLAQMLVS